MTADRFPARPSWTAAADMPATDCFSAEQLLRYLLQPVGFALSEKITAHLARCPACTARLDMLTHDPLLQDCLTCWRRAVAAGEEFDELTVKAVADTIPGAVELALPPDAVATDAMPQRLGPYRLERLLGYGGTGSVYLARSKARQLAVALKIATRHTAMNADLRQRFLREAQIVSLLDHPHIVRVYEAGELFGVCFVASEFIPGPNLASWLASQGYLGVDAARLLVAQLADGVEHAHKKGVLHRDIKPANVLLDPTARRTENYGQDFPFSPKLSDFGLAKLMDTRDSDGTAPGWRLGTLPYLSPEQAAGRPKELGRTTDVYALGAVLYELLAGRPPFETESLSAAVQQVIHDTPTALSALRPDVPPQLDTICQTCLQKKPGQRYPTAAALASALRSIT